MNKVFEKIIEKQEELFQDLNAIEVLSHVDFDSTIQNSLDNFLKAVTNEAIEIVKQEAEKYEECYKYYGGISMNDRYLYRAKRKDDGEWISGYLYGIWERKYILWGMINDIPNMTEVDTSTICQCTGLKDKNGKLIWENDIVKGKYYDNGKSHRHIGQVKYIYEAYKVVGVKQYTGYHAHLDGSYEVIGNIFDNKELLESEDKNESNY